MEVENSKNLEYIIQTNEKIELINQKKSEINQEKNNIQKEKPNKEAEKVNSAKMIIEENKEISPKKEPKKEIKYEDFWRINEENIDANFKKITTANNNSTWCEQIPPNINEPKNTNNSGDWGSTIQNDKNAWGNSD